MTVTSQRQSDTDLDGFIALIRERANEIGSVRKLAKAIGVSASYLLTVTYKTRPPGPKVLSYFGYEAVTNTTYRPKG